MKQTVMITSPLEAENVARLRAVDPARLDIIHEPELLPPTRYEGDHKGIPFARDNARWRALLARADILWDLPQAEDVPFATALKWIQTTSTGVGQSVTKLGIPRDVLVTTARGVHARPLAEFVFMALLGHWRGREYLRREQEARRYERYCGEEVAGRTMVIVGAGDLARGCAKLARAFDMHVVALARDPSKVRAHQDLFDEVLPSDPTSLRDAFRRADAVVVTVPHTPQTDRMVDAAAFDVLRRGAAFVNIARGQVIDEAALIAGLRDGRVGFAALDVATIEPLPRESPLWAMENVLISPHSASTVRGENARIVDIFAENLRCWLDGRRDEMRNVLDTALMY
jgi:phosphoglycerate dehydrogenase-like enzyme